MLEARLRPSNCRDPPAQWRHKRLAPACDGCPSRGETIGHGPGRAREFAVVPLVRPRFQELPPGTGHEADFVIGHGFAECLDLLPVPVFRPLIDGFAARRPDFRLGIHVEQDGSERAAPISPMHLASQREGMLEQLRRIQVGEALRMVAQPIADALVSAHPIAPDRAPVGIAQ